MRVVIKKTGQIKNVPDGFAKNHLIPNGLAVIATQAVIAELEQSQKLQTQQQQTQQKEWDSMIVQLQKQPLIIHAPANTEGVLFGAVNAPEIADAAKKRGAAIEQKWIQAEHYKNIGEYTVRFVLPNKKSYPVTIRIEAEQ